MKYMNLRHIIISLVLAHSCTLKSEMPGFEGGLFKNSPLSKIAKAIEDGDSNYVKHILKEKSLDLNYHEPKYGNTVLMLAVAQNQFEIVNTLLINGANVDETDYYDNATALIYACNNYSLDCSTKMVELLIDYKANVNFKQKINRVEQNGAVSKVINTPLTLASKNGCISVAQTLLNAGADINISTYYEGYGAITEALLQENLEMARFLIIERKAKIPTYCFIRNQGSHSEQLISVAELIGNIKTSQNKNSNKIKIELLEYLRKLQTKK
jgi:ankyrin repeat protein